MSDRIAQLHKELGKARIKDRERAKHLTKIRPLVADLTTIEDSEKKRHWLKIAEAIDEAINGGLAVTDHELRGLLAPLTKQIPTNSKYPEGFRTVLAEYEAAAKLAAAAEKSAASDAEEVPASIEAE
ncbi:MAG: hypothetical protein QM811_09565 [Pirellulales bacterium]